MRIALSLLILMTLVIYGCKKETITLSQAQTNQEALQKAISTSNVKRVFIINDGDPTPSSYDSSVGNGYAFSDGFISVTGYTNSYNLRYVKSYFTAKIMITDGSKRTEEQVFFIVLDQTQK